MPRHKLRSQQICERQNGLCALCKQPIPDGPNRMCYYEPKNVVVCRTCNVVIHNYVRLVEPGGVSVADMTAFMAQPPATGLTATTTKWKPDQLATGQKLFDGDMTIGGRNRLDSIKCWCNRANVQLAQYEEMFGLIEEPHTQTTPDRLMIGGVMCEVVDGEWAPVDSQRAAANPYTWGSRKKSVEPEK